MEDLFNKIQFSPIGNAAGISSKNPDKESFVLINQMYIASNIEKFTLKNDEKIFTRGVID